MGYHIPKARLFQLSKDEKRKYFKTEYIIGNQYMELVIEFPTYAEIREKAENWCEYFSFTGMYAMFSESDSFETPLAKDGLIYRIDTTDAFPIGTLQLDCAGVNLMLEGKNFNDLCKEDLLHRDLSQVLSRSWCDIYLDTSLKKDKSSAAYFLEPFSRIQEIRNDYIDAFLDTLCYFYPDFIGDFFKRYLRALQQQCYEYWKEKR